MAKPAKVKKNQAAATPGKKGEGKTVPKAAARDKAKEAKAGKPEAKGFKGRVAKAQSAKNAKPAKAKAAAKDKRSAAKFLREVRLELSKVTWPNREELIQSTIVVLIAVVIAGVFIWIFDGIFSSLISWLS